MLTEKGSFFVWQSEVNGIWHKDFEMRLPTLEDVECALESAQAEVGAEVSPARISRYKWAACLIRLGDLDASGPLPRNCWPGLPALSMASSPPSRNPMLKKLAAASAQPAPSA